MATDCCHHHVKFSGKEGLSTEGLNGREQLFPGLELSMVSLKAEEMQCCQERRTDIWEIHYCHFGHLRRQYPDGSQLDMGHGDFSIMTAQRCAAGSIVLPNGFYEGLVIRIELRRFLENFPEILATGGVSPDDLEPLFTDPERITFIPACEHIEFIFAPFFDGTIQFPLVIRRVKIVELLLFMLKKTADEVPQSADIPSEQFNMIHELHDYLLQHLGEHITINLLAKKFLTNPTTIKRVFKEIYGNSLAAHIKEHRLEKAAALLKETTASIAEIAAQVGYGSQSKFSEAFKEYFGVLPTAYRRSTQRTD